MGVIGKDQSGSSVQVSIADVAKHAGCAPATVSRRLNDPSKVADATKQAIDAAIDELGYVRNDSARALRSSRSHLVGAIIPTLRHSIYAEMLAGLQQTLSAEGFALIHNTSNYDLEQEHHQARTLIERGVEAIVMVGTRHRTKTFNLLKSRNVGFVATYALQPGFQFSSIGFDNRQAAAIAANKLLDLGHKRFAMLAGITHNNDRAQARVDGFIEALESRGLGKDDVVIAEAKYLIEDGRQAMEDILSKHADITAIFCGSDILAVGALRACRDRGIRVPDQMSIIGFDNLEIAAFTEPPLSTLNVPAFDMGVEAANSIITADPSRPMVRKVELEVSLIERSTTSAAPATKT